MATVYLNSQFVPAEEAVISPDDRGFYFGDGVYEVMKYYKGRSFCFSDHLARLKNSLHAVRIQFDDFAGLQQVCEKLIRVNSLYDRYAGIYIQITRGALPRIHRFPDPPIKPTVFIRAFEFGDNRNDLHKGISVITRQDIRWLLCHIKAITLLPNTLLFQEAFEQGAGECFLIRNGHYTEATHSNIMAVWDGKVITHPDGNLILPGITKKVVIGICKRLGIPLEERPIRSEETPLFRECFITGTGSEIMPVIRIDGKSVADGLPGPITRTLQQEFFSMTKSSD